MEEGVGLEEETAGADGLNMPQEFCTAPYVGGSTSSTSPCERGNKSSASPCVGGNVSSASPFVGGVRGGKPDAMHDDDHEHNRRSELELRRYLRRNMTRAETKLWSLIRRKQLGIKFRRQHSVGPYVLDFYAPSLRLAIEVDGDTHFHPEAFMRDIVRQNWIEEADIDFMRFTDEEVLEDPEMVIEAINKFVDVLLVDELLDD